MENKKNIRKNNKANKEMKGKEEKDKEKNTLKIQLKKNLEINDEEGLKISYNKSDLETQFPQLMHELSVKKKTLKIEGVDDDIEQEQEEIEEHPKEPYCEDLENPGAIDFLRRCTETEDALKILDFLLEQNKLSSMDYHRIKNRIKEEGGLKELLLECGGLKTPGYYEKKFPRKKNLTDGEL
ncbi:MAG TPA: DUF2095 family protein [Candidatus Nanopelagicaceae bacterium]|jgi:hypothetical protein|nr:DUF2095 family protein [Candidatus Nanopelagicaceae bacterium]